MLTVDFSRIPLEPGFKVLDAGCGAGRHLAEAQAAVRGQAEFERRVEVVRVGYEYTQTMIELLGLYRTLGRAGVPLWFFSREGDEAQAAFFKLPGGKLPASQAEYWKDKPTQPRPRAELIKLLERAKFLGDERERILNQYAELPALSRGLYQMTVDEGIRPWHQTVKAELEKLTKSTEEEKK